LTGAKFDGANLSNTNFIYANFSNVSFRQADLSNADGLGSSNVSSVDFTGAIVQGTNFAAATSVGFTAAKLYSTASYQNGDLAGINFQANNMTGWNFAGKNLANVSFYGATTSSANFTDSIVRGAQFGGDKSLTSSQLYSTASYKTGDLSEIQLIEMSLAGWNFAGQDLARARIAGSSLPNANLTDAKINGAVFDHPTGVTAAQFYATASYKDANLTDIFLFGMNLAGWNFSGQNLTNAVFAENTLTSASFEGADTRGAYNQFFDPNALINTNMIRWDGRIAGLDLAETRSLLVRNYRGNPSRGTGPIPILVEQRLAIDSTGALRMRFDEDNWHSLVSFAPGIPVTLDGTLHLEFAAGVNVAGQIGRTIRLFDWTGVMPVGRFNVASPYVWDLSKLYTTGEVTLSAVPEPCEFTLVNWALASLLIHWLWDRARLSAHN
jgi:uncharacterized protein YjbI with pentapeptide repeats